MEAENDRLIRKKPTASSVPSIFNTAIYCRKVNSGFPTPFTL